jgi:hypothetical protein
MGKRESRVLKLRTFWIPGLPPDQVRGSPGMTVFFSLT